MKIQLNENSSINGEKVAESLGLFVCQWWKRNIMSATEEIFQRCQWKREMYSWYWRSMSKKMAWEMWLEINLKRDDGISIIFEEEMKKKAAENTERKKKAISWRLKAAKAGLKTSSAAAKAGEESQKAIRSLPQPPPCLRGGSQAETENQPKPRRRNEMADSTKREINLKSAAWRAAEIWQRRYMALIARQSQRNGMKKTSLLAGWQAVIESGGAETERENIWSAAYRLSAWRRAKKKTWPES